MNKFTLFNAEKALVQVAQREHEPSAVLEDLLKAKHSVPEKESAPAA